MPSNRTVRAVAKSARNILLGLSIALFGIIVLAKSRPDRALDWEFSSDWHRVWNVLENSSFHLGLITIAFFCLAIAIHIRRKESDETTR